MKIMTKSLGWAKDNWQVMLVFSYLLLVPFSRAAAVPTAVMAIAGLVLLLRGRVDYKSSAVRLFIVVFLCFWLPIVLSLPGAYASAASAKVAANFLQYLFMGLFVIDVFKGEHLYSRHRWFLSACSVVIAFWVIDALFQLLTGFNTFGFDLVAGRLNGIFGDANPKLGIFLATFSSLLIVHSRRSMMPVLQLGTVVSLAIVVSLAGSRSGWIMFVVVLSGYVAWLVWGEMKLKACWVVLSGLVVCLSFVGLYFLSQPFASRMDTALLLFSGDYEAVNTATSFRLPIWETALRIIAANPVNGVGARGFRYAYPDYADVGDIFVADQGTVGAFHAHQLLLDIASETGLIGLMGYAAVVFLLVVTWLRSDDEQRQTMLPFGLALLAVFFPLNTHLATYSSGWSVGYSWLLALYFASVQMPMRIQYKSANSV